MKSLALLPLAVSLLSFVAVADAATNMTTCTVCWLYPSPISDLGWSFNMNQARVKTAEELHRQLPNANITTYYVENFGKMGDSRATMLEGTLLNRTEGGWACDIIFSNSITNFRKMTPSISSIATDHPDVLFVDHNGPNIYKSGFPSNLKFTGVDIWGLWFLAGAAAGAEFIDGGKICMFVPFHGQNTGVNAFLAGMQFADSQATLHISKTFTFSNEELELNVAKQLVVIGCNVVVRWADSRQSDLYVSTLNNGTWSIGYASDTAAYVGDSVLTSIYFTMNNYFTNVTLAHMHGTTIPTGLQYYDSGALQLGTVSDKASNVARAVSAAAIEWLKVNRSNLFCGSYNYVNGSAFTASAANGCVSDGEILSNTFALDSAVEELSRFRAPSYCKAGGYYTYDATLQITCTPCPVNTFSSADGAASCTDCGEGKTSAEGATVCEINNDLTFPVWGIILIVLVVVLAVIVAVVVLIFTRGKPVYTPGAAPMGPEVTLFIVSLDLKHNNKWRQNFLPVVDTMSELVTRAASEAKAYIVSSVGEVHLLAVDSPSVAYHFLEIIRQEASQQTFPVSVRIRAAIHHGKPRIVHRKKKKDGSGFDDTRESDSATRIRYAGRELDTVRVLFRKCADTGGVWCSAAALAKNPPQNATFGPELQVAAGKDAQSMIQLLGFSGGASSDSKGADFSNLVFGSNASKVDVMSHSGVSGGDGSIGSASLNTHSGSSGGEGDETRDLALATLAMISPEEFEAAHDLTAEIIRSFVGLLPYKDGVQALTTASRRLHLRDPSIPSDLPQKELGMRILRQPINAVSTALLRQLEELELVMVMDRWHSASLAREAAVRDAETEAMADHLGSQNLGSSEAAGSEVLYQAAAEGEPNLPNPLAGEAGM